LEALIVAIWLEPEPAERGRPTSRRGGAPSSRALAVLLEPVLRLWPQASPGYRVVLLVPGTPPLRYLSTAAALGWVLQEHTPLLVDARLFGHAEGIASRWPPPGSAFYDFLATLEALGDL
jgi:hypothetical protein